MFISKKYFYYQSGTFTAELADLVFIPLVQYFLVLNMFKNMKLYTDHHN